MPKNESLDVKKLEDRAENEPSQISEKSEYTTHALQKLILSSKGICCNLS
jgi:hypothetical protein